MPRAVPEGLSEKLRQRLRSEGPLSFETLVAGAGAPKDAVRAALQLECLRGRVLYDIARGAYRPRELMATPVDEAVIRFGSEREARAHRLLGDGGPGAGEVKVTKVHEVVGEGTRIHGEVVDREAVRSFFPVFTLDLEGRVTEASCGCPHFRRSGVREGPCEHMMALRLAYARQRAEEEALRQTPEGRKLIRAETRSYVRREATRPGAGVPRLAGRQGGGRGVGPAPGRGAPPEAVVRLGRRGARGLLRAPGGTGLRRLHRRGLRDAVARGCHGLE